MRALDDLRLFQHLARTRHFGRSSAECHVSPSTLSRTIARLEAELGVRLFDRDRRSVTLTPDGVRFGRFADEVLERWSRYSADADGGVAGPLTGTLTIYCTVTASQSLLPEVLSRFREAHPEVHLALETGYAADALDRLAEGTVDITVAPLPDRVPRDLLFTVITRTPLVFVAAGRRPRRLPRTDDADAWRRVPLVLPATGLTRVLVDRWLRRRRLSPRVEAEVQGHEAVLSLVTLGVGVGVVPELVATKSPLAAGLRMLRTDPPLPAFDIGVCTVPERLASPVVAAFWHTVGA